MHSLPRRPKLRNLQANQDYEVSELAKQYFGQKFGDVIAAYHKILSERCESRHNHRYAVVVQDLATLWIQSFPCKTKTSQETEKSLRKFLGPSEKPKVTCTYSSLEFGKSCEDLSWNHCTSTPHRSETSGIAEGAVRRVKEGTSAVLLQSGLDEQGGRITWNVTAICEMFETSWPMGEHFTRDDLENHLKDRSFRSEQRLNIFRSLRKTSQSSTIVCGEGNLEGRCFGCRDRGAGKIGRVGKPRSKAQCNGNNYVQKGEHVKFPIADDTAKLLGRDHETRESTLRQYELLGSEDLCEELQRSSDGSQPTETKRER